MFRWFNAALFCGLLHILAPPPSEKPVSVKFDVRKDPTSSLWSITDNLRNTSSTVPASAVWISKGLITVPTELFQDGMPTLSLPELFKSGGDDDLRRFGSFVSLEFQNSGEDALVLFYGAENGTKVSNKSYKMPPEETEIGIELSTAPRRRRHWTLLVELLVDTPSPLKPLASDKKQVEAQVSLSVQVVTAASQSSPPTWTTSFAFPVLEGHDILASLNKTFEKPWEFGRLMVNNPDSVEDAISSADSVLTHLTNFHLMNWYFHFDDNWRPSWSPSFYVISVLIGSTLWTLAILVLGGLVFFEILHLTGQITAAEANRFEELFSYACILIAGILIACYIVTPFLIR